MSLIAVLSAAVSPSSWLELLVWKFTPRSTPTPSCSQAPQSASRRPQTPWCRSSTPRYQAHYLSVSYFSSCCWTWNCCFFCSSSFLIRKCPCASSGSEQTMRGGSSHDGIGSELHHKQEVALWQEALLLRRPSCEFSTSFRPSFTFCATLGLEEVLGSAGTLLFLTPSCFWNLPPVPPSHCQPCWP